MRPTYKHKTFFHSGNKRGLHHLVDGVPGVLRNRVALHVESYGN